MTNKPFFSVIIPNFNGRHYLGDCLDSLLSCQYPKDKVEWIVVDNGSRDGSVEFIQDHYPKVGVVRLDSNTGFVGGISAGVAAAQGRYLVFLNNDMRVSQGWLEAFESALHERQVSCATGMILSWDGRTIDFIRGLLMFDGHALQYAQGAEAGTFKNTGVHNTFIACGGNMVVERELYLRLGGFDNDFFAYTEDVDFSWRLHAAGYSSCFVPDALVYHHHQGTSTALGVYKRGFLYERNAFMTLFKNIDQSYFADLLHLAWVTLIHRSREIIKLHAPGSEIFGVDPYNQSVLANRPAEDTLRKSKASFLNTASRYLAKFNYYYKRHGITATLSRSLIRLGEKLSPREAMRQEPSDRQININHPHIISQLQTIWYILDNLDRLGKKRNTVQQLRRRPDSELFQEFPPWIVTTYPGDELLFLQSDFRDLLPKEIPFRFATLDEVHAGT